MDFKEALTILAQRQAQPSNNPTSYQGAEDTTVFHTSSYSSSSSSSSSSSVNGSGSSSGGASRGGTISAADTASSGPDDLEATAALQAALEQVGTLELLNLVTSLQGERVETYASYNTSIHLLIEQQRVAEYPLLCAETTSVFAVLSARMRSIRDILLSRSLASAGKESAGNSDGGVFTIAEREAAGSASTAITQLQEKERDKLTLVAAQHLDILSKAGSVSSKVGGGIVGMEGMTLLAQPEYVQRQLKDLEGHIAGHLESIQAAKCELL